MIGETLKKIRLSRHMTQKALCEGVMTQATYSRIERGLLEIDAQTLYTLVDRLNVTMNEFFYIHYDAKLTPKQQLLNDFLQIELVLPAHIEKGLADIARYTSGDEDVKMLHQAYMMMHALLTTQDLTKVRARAAKIWSSLEKLEQWYIRDLEMINTIILYFPLDVAKEVANTAMRRLDTYDHYDKDMTYLRIYFYLNLSSLYLEAREFAACLALLIEIRARFEDHLTYQTLGFLLVRQIVCHHHLKKPYDSYVDQLHMLQQLFHNEAVFTLLHQELVLNGIRLHEKS